MNNNPFNDLNRRDFLKGSSMATLMAMMGGIEIRAEDAAPATGAAASAATPAATNAATAEPALTVIPVGPTVKYGIIGMGPQGRDIATELGKLPNAPVTAICDNYPTSLRRGSEVAPKAEKFPDYKKLLASPNVQAVVVATPTHMHKEIVLDALAAGKHVYCEAPLANSIEDAKIIAKAAKEAVKVVFQSGLQLRAYPKRQFLIKFMRSGSAGNFVGARAQYHKKTEWKRASANSDREAALNWRLSQKTSTGLIGEFGIHQLDLISWIFKSRPNAVTGFSSLIKWTDGRDVADTVQAVLEYPGGANLTFDATIANSFDSSYENIYGTDAAVMIRGGKAWMFKEPDSPLLGFEVYARKDTFFGETGLALAAGSTSQKALKANEKKGEIPDGFPNSPLYYALEAFTANTGLIGQTVEDFVSNFKGGDKNAAFDPDESKALLEQIGNLKIVSYPGWEEGLEATIVAIKANEASVKKQRIVIPGDIFKI